jgi:DNA-binding NtrC family response regulator
MLTSSFIGLAQPDIHLATQVAVPVLVTSPDRDERDLCARLIHARQGGGGPFVTFLESGGAPPDPPAAIGRPRSTDYVNVLRHKFEQARGGTLFVDDIVTFTSGAQTELFSLLDERGDARPGSRDVNGSVRIIAGASRRLDVERDAGTFSAALFYRLNVIHVDFANSGSQANW